MSFGEICWFCMFRSRWAERSVQATTLSNRRLEILWVDGWIFRADEKIPRPGPSIPSSALRKWLQIIRWWWYPLTNNISWNQERCRKLSWCKRQPRTCNPIITITTIIILGVRHFLDISLGASKRPHYPTVDLKSYGSTVGFIPGWLRLSSRFFRADEKIPRPGHRKSQRCGNQVI